MNDADREHRAGAFMLGAESFIEAVRTGAIVPDWDDRVFFRYLCHECHAMHEIELTVPQAMSAVQASVMAGTPMFSITNAAFRSLAALDDNPDYSPEHVERTAKEYDAFLDRRDGNCSGR